MNVVRAVILALWIACAALLGLIAGTLAVVPIAMEESLSPEVVPWLLTAIALSGSIVAAFLARLIPSVARTYSLARLILAGCVGWPLAWWIGVQTKDTLKSASSDGIFAISATIEHMTVWNAVVAVVALLILLVPRRSAGPSETAA